jgi:uncharacterized membrane protein YphA (DoxX/SURF4 family)
MVYYGWPKIRDLNANANDFIHMGFRPGMLWGTLIALVEFGGGIAVFLGIYAELAAALFAYQMMVGTSWKVKISKPFTDYSYDLQLFALCLILMSQGAGAFALVAFPASLFLRWDVAAVALTTASLFAVLCKPQLATSKQPEQRPSENLAATLEADHEGNLRVIRDLQSRVSVLRQEAMEEIREDLKILAEKLERLAERATREVRDLKDGLDFTLLEVQVGLRLTVDDAKAHLKVIEAKRDLVRARLAISHNDLSAAEAGVEAALRHLEEAQSLALGHHENIAAVRKQAEEMLVAVRAKAYTLKTSIDALLEHTDQLLEEMRGSSTATRTAA